MPSSFAISGQNPPALSDRLPEQIGKYRPTRLLGAGAYGFVYLCQDPDLDRAVSVKILKSVHFTQSEAIERFQREARTAARISHPNIVAIYEAGIDQGQPFLVMEYVPGHSLDHLIGTPRLNVETTLRVIFHLSQALQAAHDNGILHRDVKSANILIDVAGRPKLADFGLARLESDAPGLSRSGDLIGTPRYMSPEQALLTSSEIDARTDVYSLGAVMYEMLCGQPVADGPTAMAILRQVTDGQPIPVHERRPDLAPEVAAICMKMLARDREQRYRSAREVAVAIQDYYFRAMFGHPEVEPLAGLPLAVPGPSHHYRRSRYVWVAGILVIACILFAVYIGYPSRTTPSVNDSGKPIDLSQVLREGQRDAQALAGIVETPRYRQALLQLLEDTGLAVRQFPEDAALRQLRGMILRRAGECLETITWLESSDHPESVTERALARYQWEIILLGSIPEHSLRPVPSAALLSDWQKLDASWKWLSALVKAVVKRDWDELDKLLADGQSNLPIRWRADAAMIEADVVTRYAESVHDEWQSAGEEDKAKLRKKQELLEARSAQALRRGLEQDSHHLGLLFLKAMAWQRRVSWESAEGDDREQLERRHRPAFESASQRFRAAVPRTSMEMAAARAILLDGFGKTEKALDQLNDIAVMGKLPSDLVAFRSWLQLQSPPDGNLNPAYVASIRQTVTSVIETHPEVLGLHLSKAVIEAVSGKWEDARRDLLDARKTFRGSWPPSGTAYQLAEVVDQPTLFLNRLIDTISDFPSPMDVRIQLGDEYLRRLNAKENGMSDEERKQRLAEGHYRQARFHAQKDDRSGVLIHVTASLKVRHPDFGPNRFREDNLLNAWNNDEAFQKLYAKY